MTDDFASLYAYNAWADERVLEACRALSDEQYTAEPIPGWSSIQSSLVHIAIVTDAWLRGLAGETSAVSLTQADLPTIDDIARVLTGAQTVFREVLAGMTAARLEAPMTLRRGERSATLPPWTVLRHVVNHSTYHRGQVAAKLKRFGIDPPATDLIVWVFESMPQSQ